MTMTTLVCECVVCVCMDGRSFIVLFIFHWFCCFYLFVISARPSSMIIIILHTHW